MKTLLNVCDRGEVLRRLANVRVDAQPKWGTMSAHQMICHLSDSLRAALNEKYISPSTSLFKRTILKPLALWVPISWPHGFKTRPEMDQRQGGTPPVDFASDLEELRGLFEQAELVGQFDTADRLAPLMATASGISGNPRLIKRFLNALAIRMSISKAHGVGVDEAVLAKMLLFERLGSPKAYAELTKAVAENDQGKPAFLADWEVDANAGKKLELSAPWDDPFVKEWLTLYPRLADHDLRGVLYVSRELIAGDKINPYGIIPP